jgi:hypothetical protein
VYQWRLLLEEYRPKIVYIKGIHNTVADAVLRLEYDPSVNQTGESVHTKKDRNKQSRQRQCWMTFVVALVLQQHQPSNSKAIAYRLIFQQYKGKSIGLSAYLSHCITGLASPIVFSIQFGQQ